MVLNRHRGVKSSILAAGCGESAACSAASGASSRAVTRADRRETAGQMVLLDMQAMRVRFMVIGLGRSVQEGSMSICSVGTSSRISVL